MEALNWQPELGSRLLVVARETGEQVTTMQIGSRYCLHLINCFEEGGQLTVDVLELDHPIYDQYQTVPDLFNDVCPGRPRRLVIDLDRREVGQTAEIDYLSAPDFPSICPKLFTRPYQDFWMLGISATGRPGRKFFDQLAHANWTCAKACDMYQAPPSHYLGGEPIFVADPKQQRAGVVICQVFDAEKMAIAFAIFDAFNVARGPLATIRLNEPIHLGFHASFKPDAESCSQSLLNVTKNQATMTSLISSDASRKLS